MKILMLSWEYPPHVVGGLGRHVADLTPALSQLNLEVHVLTRAAQHIPHTQAVQANLIVHRVVSPSLVADADIFTRATHINDAFILTAQRLWDQFDGFDVIHAHDWLVSFAALQLRKLFHIPLIATIHATEQGRWRNEPLPNPLSQSIDQAERQFINEADALIACSHYMVEDLTRTFQQPKEKIHLIPNGIRVDHLPQYPTRELAAFRETYAGSDEQLIFSVGRLVYEKGQKVLVGAMPQVLNAFPNAKLVLAGKGPLQGELEDEICYLGLQNNVHLVGFVTDEERDKFFAVADCAVFPSLYEPFGIVALEAMALGCPVIASETGGLAEVVEHNRTGLYIYPNNSDSTAWGILQVLRNPQKAAQRATVAQRLVAQKFNWHHIAQQTTAVYQQTAQSVQVVNA